MPHSHHRRGAGPGLLPALGATRLLTQAALGVAAGRRDLPTRHGKRPRLPGAAR